MNPPYVRDSRTARQIAVEVIFEVFEKGAYANIALQRTLCAGSPIKDRNLATEIVNGTTRMVRHLDWVLDLFLAKPIGKQQPWVRSILRASLYQLIFMDRIPAYACVDDAVKIATRKASKPLGSVVNAVLRNYLRQKDQIRIPDDDKLQYLGIKYSYPDYLVEEFMQLGDLSSTEQLMAYMNKPPGLTARCNVLRIGRDELVKRLKKEGADCEAGPYTPWSVRFRGFNRAVTDLPSYKEGLFYLQNEASMLAGAILDPAGGQVYDLGAGVGGKSTHLAELMGDKGRVVAVELHQHKLGLLKENCRRLGIRHVRSKHYDLLKLPGNLSPADQVLLDAPCSGWGVLNRRSDSRWRQNPEELGGLPDLQYEMLKAAAKMVKQGGSLLYSTCTINKKENEQVVTRFLKEAPFFLQGFAEKIAFFPLQPFDYKEALQGWLTLRPGRYDCDGMFYALLKRGEP